MYDGPGRLDPEQVTPRPEKRLLLPIASEASIEHTHEYDSYSYFFIS